MKYPRLVVTAFLYCMMTLSSSFGQTCATSSGKVFPFPDGGYRVVVTYSLHPLNSLSNFYAITGKPYSAKETLRVIQTLPDGTKNESFGQATFHYRDSSGRTRTESPLNLSEPSPLPEATDVPVVPEIFDPVSGYCYYLDTYNRTVYRIAWSKSVSTDVPPLEPVRPAKDLGTKKIAGIEARGFQTTTTQTFVDEQMTSEFETWASTKYDILLSWTIRRTNSRYIEETVSTLANLKRSKPDSSFFRIPNGYRIIDEKIPFTISFPPAVSSRGRLQSIFDPPTVRILLESTGSKEQAWGAWLAGEGRMDKLAPLLQQVVAKRLNGEDWIEDGLPINAALDALIKLSHQVPVELISDIYPKWPAHALILLSKRSKFNDLAPADAAFLLDLAAREKGYRWFATANLLLKHRVVNTAALLLRNLAVNAVLCVISEGDTSSCTFGGVSGFSGGDGGIGRAEGYPPLTYYYLTGANSTLLADGPTAVYYSSVTSRPGEAPTGPIYEITGRPNPDDIFQYLERLLNRSSGTLPLHAAEYRELLNKQKSLELEIGDFRADILERYNHLLRITMEANLLTEEEKASLPPLKIDIQIKYPPKPEQ